MKIETLKELPDELLGKILFGVRDIHQEFVTEFIVTSKTNICDNENLNFFIYDVYTNYHEAQDILDQLHITQFLKNK
ncbi:MAG: hypothetical protein COA63_014040 [Methylophaga sp.]|nr:hypothetical protein [Methylophaga sp.]